MYVKGGQRRVYLKRVEGTGYVDPTYSKLREAALKAGLAVGGYNFLHPTQATPSAAAAYFLKQLKLPLVHGRDLRPCLDCEWVGVTPDARVGRWITEVAAIMQKKCGVAPLIYGGGFWLEACQLPKAPGPLWLAAYGRNDGREYPVGRLPKPWKAMAAHQYTSVAHVLGINGKCDLSHVFVPASVDVPKKKKGA